MTISFNQIPPSMRAPGTYIEIDNSKALRGLNQFETKIVVIGQCLPNGSMPAGQITLCSSAEQAKTFWGQGSMLANMFKALKDNGTYISTYGIGLSDVSGGSQASATVSVSGSATENGTLFLYVGGKLVRVPVSLSDSANVVASSIATAINSMPDLPVTATVSTNVVTITYRHKGTIGNQIDVRLNYFGQVDGEKVPAGLTVTPSVFSGGATDPNVQTAINALPEKVYDFIVMPYTDSNNLLALENELKDRWGPMRQLYGLGICHYKATLSGLSTFGNSRNSQYISCEGIYNPTYPTYEYSAALTSVEALNAAIDPARPPKGLTLSNILPPAENDIFTLSERNVLLYDGISTFTVSESGQIEIDRLITMYQTNTVNSPDPSYLDVTTMTTLQYICRDAKTFIDNTYGKGYKVVDNGNEIDPGQKVVTPNDIRAALIGRALLWRRNGLVENIEQFERDLIVQRNASNPNRMDALLPPDLVNGLLQFALQFQFLL